MVLIYALLPFVRVPCQTRAVERGIILVTEASQVDCGEIARIGLGLVRNRIESRQKRRNRWFIIIRKRIIFLMMRNACSLFILDHLIDI